MCLHRSLAILLTLVAGTSACGGGWHRLDDLTPRALPARAQVQVWQGGRATVLHAVKLESETLRGVPYIKPPTCDSCRLYLPLERVDSLRVGSKERGFFGTVGWVFAISAVWGYLFRGVGGD